MKARREHDILNEYEVSQAYHVELRMSRQWLPRYFRRFHIVEEFLNEYLPRQSRIADVGGGEGILVKRLIRRGFERVVGVDPYAPFLHKQMVRGSIFNLPFSEATFDAVICLDVLEHIPLHLQQEAAVELTRVLRSGGLALVSAPNMAHLKSRIDFLTMGKPWRNSLKKHPGELSIHERIDILEEAGLVLTDSVGLHLTLNYDPCPKGLFGKLLSRIMFSPHVPASLCWTVVLLLHNGSKPEWMTKNKRPLKRAMSTYLPCPEDPTCQS